MNGKPENNSLLQKKSTFKQIPINYKGTRMIKDGED